MKKLMYSLNVRPQFYHALKTTIRLVYFTNAKGGEMNNTSTPTPTPTDIDPSTIIGIVLGAVFGFFALGITLMLTWYCCVFNDACGCKKRCSNIRKIQLQRDVHAMATGGVTIQPRDDKVETSVPIDIEQDVQSENSWCTEPFYYDNPDEEKCSICLNVMKENVVCLLCLHKFDYECIKMWAKNTDTLKCPLCITSLSK